MHAATLPMSPVQLLVSGAIFVAVILFRMRGMTRQRRLRTETLWVVPVIIAGFAVLAMAQTPPSLSDAPWLAAFGVLGAIVGWYRGKMMRITVDPQTHALSQSASPLAMLFLLAIFGLRYGLRYLLGEEAQAWGISLNLLADAPLVFAVAMFAMMRVEMFIRAERLLAEARAAHSTAPVTSEPGAS